MGRLKMGGLLECVLTVLLKLNCKELYNRMNEKYDDIFSEKIQKIKMISTIIQKVLEERKELLVQK